MIFNMNAAADANLNFDVVMQAEQPIPSDNLIWVENDTQLVDWAIASENPYVSYKDMDLLDGAVIEAGYLGTGGAVSSQNSTNLEQFTVDYFDVEFGKVYEWSYTLSESKSQWIAINEYKIDGTHVQRLTPVNGVSGTLASGVYTPSANTVAKVRLSWRTFGVAECNVSFINPKVEYTPETTEVGSLWIKTSENANHHFSSIDEKNVLLSPCGAKVYTSNGWVNADTYICKIIDDTENWEQLQEIKYLYNHGDQCKDITAYWIKNSGTLTLKKEDMHIKGSTGRVVTTNKIDTTGFKTIEFDVLCTSSSANTQVGIGTSQTAFVNYVQAEKSMTDYATISVDITGYQGLYYIQVYTTASSVGCYIKSIRLIS